MMSRSVVSQGVGFILRALITVYQWTLSALIGRTCRFEPSCSGYMAEAIFRHGPWKGVGLGVKRIARCHPWGDSGFDPVPETTLPAAKTCAHASCSSSQVEPHAHV